MGSCRPYRAPETIFSPPRYDPFAVDLWSLGAVIAEFFTAFSFVADDEDDIVESPVSVDGEDDGPIPSYRNIELYDSKVRGNWYRDSLFDASRGAIGLAWSIFKIRGDRKSTRLNSSHSGESRMPSSA